MAISARRFLSATALTLCTVFAAPLVAASTINLVSFNSDADGLELSVDIAVEDGMALFSFANNSTGDASGSSVARIYFEIGLADAGLSSGAVFDQTATLFSDQFGGPGAPPSSNNIGWRGNIAAFGANAPAPTNGLNVGDSLTIAFAYDGTLQALVSAITDADGNARIAAHVLDCSGGQSCAVTVVPLPAALPLMLAGLAALGVIRRRRV